MESRSLTQQSYVHKMLDEYGLNDIKEFDTRMDARLYEDAFARDENDFEDNNGYQ